MKSKSLILLTCLVATFGIYNSKLFASEIQELHVVRLIDKRLPEVSDTDMNEILSSMEKMVNSKIGANIKLKFIDHGVKDIDSFFLDIDYSDDPYFRYFQPIQYPINDDNPDVSKYKNDIIAFLKSWQLKDIEQFISGAKITTYDEAYEAVMEGYAGKIKDLKQLKLDSGDQLIDRLNRPYQRYTDWQGMIHHQSKYDVIITNALIVYDVATQPYPHVVLKKAKVGGGAFDSPNREALDGKVILLNVLEGYSNLEFFESQSDKKNRLEINDALGGFILAHEFGHAYYLIPDVYDHGAECLMNSSFETLDMYKGMEYLTLHEGVCKLCKPYLDAKTTYLMAKKAESENEITKAADLYRKVNSLTPPKISGDRQLFGQKLEDKARELEARESVGAQDRAEEEAQIRHMIIWPKEINDDTEIMVVMPPLGGTKEEESNRWRFEAKKNNIILIAVDIDYEKITSNEAVDVLFEKIMGVVRDIRRDKKVSEKEILLGGTSAGGMMAISMNLRYPDKIGAIVVMAGGDFYYGAKEYASAGRGENIIIVHGTQDNIVKIENVKATVTWLEYNHVNVHKTFLDQKGHNLISADYAQALKQMLKVYQEDKITVDQMEQFKKQYFSKK